LQKGRITRALHCCLEQFRTASPERGGAGTPTPRTQSGAGPCGTSQNTSPGARPCQSGETAKGEAAPARCRPSTQRRQMDASKHVAPFD
jgi:hypothetical protein